MDAKTNSTLEDVQSAPIRELTNEECESASGGENWYVALARAFGEIAAHNADRMVP